MSEYAHVRACSACRVLPEVIVWPERETADVCCMRCGHGMTGWPVDDVVAGWNKYQASLRIFQLTPPDGEQPKD